MKPINERLERTESEEEITFTDAEGISRTTVVKVQAWRDPADGEIYLDADSVAELDRARARHMGVLAPQQLAKLRERLGLTQQQIADLLQIGAKTWSRWETGREVPSRSLNLLLLAVYEGKIDLAYLRSKRPSQPQWMPEPVLRAEGWAHVSTYATLRWVHSIEPTQPEIPGLVGAGGAPFGTAYISQIQSGAVMDFGGTFALDALRAGKTEIHPLSA